MANIGVCQQQPLFPRLDFTYQTQCLAGACLIFGRTSNCTIHLPKIYFYTLTTIRGIKRLTQDWRQFLIISFKTNIECGGYIATVTPFLNEIEQLDG